MIGRNNFFVFCYLIFIIFFFSSNAYLLVMQVIGNKLANSIWESNASINDKPNANSSRFFFFLLNY